MSNFPICIGRKPGKSKLNSVINVIIILAIAVIIFETVFFARFARIYVVHSSMYPTLIGASSEKVAGGDFVYIDKYRSPERGDIVVISTDKKIIIKRLIALGGDSVELRLGALYLNDQLVEEPYVDAENNKNVLKNTYARTVVPEGYMFFLGDNRDISDDSRSETYGMLEVDCVLGVVPEWSLAYKGFFTSVNTFFEFTLPNLFNFN
ncbi:MAG: signal peptidase I [Candidatus Coproplasma sp.]